MTVFTAMGLFAWSEWGGVIDEATRDRMRGLWTRLSEQFQAE